MPKKSKKDEDYEAQIGEITADLQRVHADFVNYKRRAEEDQRRAVLIGREGTLKALLPTIDNIERALNHVPEDIANHAYVAALQKVAKNLTKDLEAMGLVRFETVGHEFDPETMEAVMMDDGEGEKEIVIEEMQPGYKLGDEVIRHAMVKVGRK
jgi:molecular chaperone GrpE